VKKYVNFFVKAVTLF